MKINQKYLALSLITVIATTAMSLVRLSTTKAMLTKLQEKQQRVLLTTAHNDYGVALNKHSYFKLGNRSQSTDLVQDTFIKTWSYLVKGGKIEVMKAFLYHVLNNLIVDEYRKRKTVSHEVHTRLIAGGDVQTYWTVEKHDGRTGPSRIRTT